MIVVDFMRVWLSSTWYDEWLYRLGTTFLFSSSWYKVYLCLDNSDEQSIYDKKNQINDRQYTGVIGILIIIIISNMYAQLSNV